MSTILVLGVGPLPVDSTSQLHAPGIRVWHLAQFLVKRHHSVVLGVIEFGDFQDNREAEFRPRQESLAERLSVCRLKYHSTRTAEALATLHKYCHFDCVVSTTDIMNSVAASIPVSLPLWLDYLGDPLSERQLQAATYNNDTSLLDLWKVMARALVHGDRFSVASTPQKYVLIGQLGLVGRLNQFTAGHELIHILPNCPRVIQEYPVKPLRALKGSMIPVKSFLLLWAGGYNTWTDPETLFRGLELTFQQDPSVYFVSVGGEIPGHDNVTFHRFRAMCEASEFASHFVFIGWVPPEYIPGYYTQADAAINVDATCYEAEIGTRTRIIDWISFRIPVITTALCEPARLLEARNLITTFQAGNPASLANAVLWVRRHHDEAKRRAEMALQELDNLYDDETVFAPLGEWAERPSFAPDRIGPDRELSVADVPRIPNCLVAQLHRRFLTTYGQWRDPATSDCHTRGGLFAWLRRWLRNA